MKEMMNRRKLITAGLAVLVVCLIIAVYNLSRLDAGIEETTALEGTTELVMESVTVPEIMVAETTTETETEETTEETEVQTVEAGMEKQDSPVETETHPVKATTEAVKETESKPQVPKEATPPAREPEPQEVEPDHEENVQPTAKPEESQGGSANDQGKVYVPGFGYVETGGGVTEIPAHSDGDWNKQVGTMQ
ncbi:DUF6550 family protein [Hungatella hathewayi]|uniref:DUF6550 family protein n=1 Tax=Hungatella hathewayi TaxID=154046 RepID=UPI00356A54E5